MKKLAFFSLCLGCLAAVSAGAADFKKSKVTQVVNDVQIISAADQAGKPAAVNDIFTMPDILRTGPESRAELVAEDQTVTRVGANTVFSFDPASRTIDLQQGSLLFHSPHGKGGGTIHTGSATASVLGSTLIVTTTPNGGFKVIVLEDEAEIHFLNGLKQTLEPGQMTFILPGGNRLAPIIVFRLDDLTHHSQLLNGFNHPLSSMPLILHEIEKQLKLIKSGRATDTGLFAGDNASPDQVEVLDADTIQSDVNNSQSLLTALKKDATINQPSLTDATIPTPPNHVFISPSFTLSGDKFFAGRSFSGFAARNIFINTPEAELFSLTVDLSPYAGKPEFDFVAAKDLDIEGSVLFDGLPSGENLSLIAGNQISIVPDVTVEADVADFELSAPGALTLDGASLLNNAGDVELAFGSGVTVDDDALIQAAGNLNIKVAGDFNLSDSTISAGDAGFEPSLKTLSAAPQALSLGGDVSINASGAINVNNDIAENAQIFKPLAGEIPTEIAGDSVNLAAGADINLSDAVINADPDAGSVTMSSGSGSVTVSGTSIQAHYLTINSGDGILLDASGQTLTATGSGATANLTAKNVITVGDADFSSFGAVNMAANTINLNDVNLGSGPVTLKSLLGLLNVGSSKSGYVNFIENVIYKGNDAQNYVNNGSGITVTTLH
jgi:hypothetical protein